MSIVPTLTEAARAVVRDAVLIRIHEKHPQGDLEVLLREFVLKDGRTLKEKMLSSIIDEEWPVVLTTLHEADGSLLPESRWPEAPPPQQNLAPAHP